MTDFEIEPLPEDEPRPQPPPVRGRGASDNPANRFQPLAYEPDLEDDELPDRPRTIYYRDTSRSVIAFNDSPDIPFDASLNPYRGCEHGCAYCYARPTHEYLGLSAGLDFETRIFVKENAPELLREQLLSPRWKPQVLALSGITDAYQPIESQLQITRRCVEVLAGFRNPVGVITKNHLVTRDIDLLGDLAGHDAAAVTLSITTLDEDLRRKLEPRTSSPRRKLDAIARLADAGIPAGVMIGPVIPGLTEPEIPDILAAAAEAGATRASYLVLRLPHGLTDLFARWLQDHVPDRASKVLNRIRALRGGRLNDSRFRTRHTGEGIFATEIAALFDLGCRKAGIERNPSRLSSASFRRPGEQMTLFE